MRKIASKEATRLREKAISNIDMSDHLSLTELESFDPRAPSGGRERRFCCPLCGQSKSMDAEHRSIAVDTDTGKWFCHRCHAKGVIKERWTQRDSKPFQSQDRRRAAVKAKFEIKPKAEPQPEPEELGKIEKIRAQYPKWVAAFPGSPAAQYLESRGIPEKLAIAAGCGYAERWERGDRRVVFPVRDKASELVAISARAIDPEYIGPKVDTRGPKKLGVFAIAGTLTAEIPIITEAPIDALSLAVAGFPAMATIGTSWPEWLPKHCSFRASGIAFDADQAGDQAAEKLTAELWSARAIRLRPVGGKDWNDILITAGAEVIRSQVCVSLGIEESTHIEPAKLASVDFAPCSEFEAAIVGGATFIEPALIEQSATQQNIETLSAHAELATIWTCPPNSAACHYEEASGIEPATIAQCCEWLTQAGAAPAVAMTTAGGIRLAIHCRHRLPDSLLAELRAHGTAISNMMLAGNFADNYCLDCHGPLCFELAERWRYVRAICSGADGCGWMRIVDLEGSSFVFL